MFPHPPPGDPPGERASFRHPGVDEDGNHVMRPESMIGRRNEHYPGDAVYAQRTAWDGQRAPQLDLMPTYTGKHFVLNAFHLNSRALSAFEKMPRRRHRLPGCWSQDDFVVTDEATGTVAVKTRQATPVRLAGPAGSAGAQQFTFRSQRSGRGVDLSTGKVVPLRRSRKLGPQTSLVRFAP